MKCEVEDCSEEPTAIVNERLNLCDGHLFDYLDSANASLSFRYFDSRRMTAYEAILGMSELPKSKILEVLQKIKRESPDLYPPSRQKLFEEGRKVEGFPGSQDTLKRYLDKLIDEGKLLRRTEPYRGSRVVPYRTICLIPDDGHKKFDW